MAHALLIPTLALCMVLLAGLALLLVLRTACLRGMGRRPMSDLSRATGPTARGTAWPARLLVDSLPPSHWQGAARRVDKRSADPRGAAPAKAWPFPSLINRPAAGAQLSPSLTVSNGDSVGKGVTPFLRN